MTATTKSAIGRGLMCFGLALPLGVVLGAHETLNIDIAKIDIDGSSTAFLSLAAVALAVGLFAAVILGRAGANLGASVGQTLALLGGLSAIGWIVLVNVGDPEFIVALLPLALATSVPILVLAPMDARASRPAQRPIDSIGQTLVAASAGFAAGASIMFVAPGTVWSNVTFIGGLIALAGAALRLSLGNTDKPSANAAKGAPTTATAGNAGVGVLLAFGFGIAAGSVIRIGPYLQEHWGASVRYDFLSLAIAGFAGVSAMLGFIWLPDRFRRSGFVTIIDVAAIALTVGAALLLIAISETLPGTIIGAGVAAGISLAAVGRLAGARLTAGRALPVGDAQINLIIGTAAAAWIATWAFWDYLVDVIGSDRWVVAASGIPAIMIAILVLTEPAARLARSSGAHQFIPTSRSRATGRSPLLEAKGVEFSYGSVQVLFGVDMVLHEGEVVALLGTNGAGKTTFLRTVAGLAQPSAGLIRFAGGDLSRFSASDRVALGINQIANPAVAPELTVAENLEMFGHTLASGEARAGAAKALEVFPRLAERLGQRASSLSGGERQMLSLSKSLVLRPRLLIIDEATLGLAPVAVGALVPVIRQLHESGASILIVEQSVQLALELADRAICMEKGRIVYEENADVLKADTSLLEAVYLEGIAAALDHRGVLVQPGPTNQGSGQSN